MEIILSRWLFIKTFLVLFGLTALLLISGYFYQTMSQEKDKEQFSPPGKIFTLNGYDMHLHCTGSGSPTVILEAASGGLTSSWGWVQPEIAKNTRVCSYDRRGRGWSTGESSGKDVPQTARDLHMLLQKAQINDKYILVGHSLGGIYTRQYQKDYPNEVVGMVLVDASHPNLLVTTPEVIEESKASVSEFHNYAKLSQVGGLRLYFALGGSLDFGTLPERERKEMAYFWSCPEHFYSMANEHAQVETLYAQGQEFESLEDLPLRIITAADATPEWERLQNDLFTLSTDSTRLTIQDSTHMSLVFKKEHADRVSTVINNLVETIKNE